MKYDPLKFLPHLARFAYQSIAERIFVGALFAFICVCIGLIVAGFAAAWHACKSFVGLPLLVALLACAGCSVDISALESPLPATCDGGGVNDTKYEMLALCVGLAACVAGLAACGAGGSSGVDGRAPLRGPGVLADAAGMAEAAVAPDVVPDVVAAGTLDAQPDAMMPLESPRDVPPAEATRDVVSASWPVCGEVDEGLGLDRFCLHYSADAEVPYCAIPGNLQNYDPLPCRTGKDYANAAGMRLSKGNYLVADCTQCPEVLP